MSPRLTRWLAVTAATAGFLTAPPTSVAAQQLPASQNQQTPGVDVLTRGPVHEAFAASVEQPAPTPVVTKAPPDAIEELPPDQKPAGENVQWLPGYWHYDEDRADFIWISGFWRVPPPGRMWVPGSWREVRGGWQWVHGMWSTPMVEQEAEYLPPPPAPIEVQPSIPAPAENFAYAPGNWVWHSNRYVWRPGVWIEHRPNWVWVPGHYRWTPAGYLFIDGYWDYPLADRGVLFTPVYISPAVYARPQFVYTPTYVVAEPCLYTSLFVRRGWGCYYFGDYFEARYVNRGYNAWCGSVANNGFAVSVSFGRGAGYDPLWSYYRQQHRHDQVWIGGVNNVYAGRFNGTVARPPVTLVQQNTVVNNITNTTIVNNTIVNNNVTKNFTSPVMATPLSQAVHTNSNLVLKPLAPAQVQQEAKFAQELRGMSGQRKQVETRLADKNVGGPAPTEAKSIKYEVSKQAVTRAQAPVSAPKYTPPPVPVKPTREATAAPVLKPALPPGVKVEPRTAIGGPPTTSPQKAEPKPATPGTGVPPPAMKPVTPPPATTPRVEPKPIAPPPPVTTPKVEPKPLPPATNPAPKPVAPPPSVPKVELKPLTPPPAAAPTPKPVVPPPSVPKLEPKPISPPPPVVQPVPAPKPLTPPPAPKPVLAPPPPKPTPAPPAPKPDKGGTPDKGGKGNRQ